MFFVIYGTGLYGRVDIVPGLFSVATKFFHIFWIPIIPLGTQIVVDETEDGWQGVPFGLSGRSVLTAYLRNILTKVGVIIMLIGGIAYFAAEDSQHAMNILPLFVMGLIGAVLGQLTLLMWREPSPEQFDAICAHLGVDPHDPTAVVPSTPDMTGMPLIPTGDPMAPASMSPPPQASGLGPHVNAGVPNQAAPEGQGSVYPDSSGWSTQSSNL